MLFAWECSADVVDIVSELQVRDAQLDVGK